MNEIFSKRQKRLRGESIEIYTYDSIPNTLRVQICFILTDVLGAESNKYATSIYTRAYNKLCREYGVKSLGHYTCKTIESRIKNVIETEPNPEKVLDILEVCLCELEKLKHKTEFDLLKWYGGTISPKDGIELLNNRFKENGVGFFYQSGEFIKIDSTYIHSEVVMPVLHLLSKANFQGANEEYLSAHVHYRHGRNKECLIDCLKAFESVLKSICTIKEWPFDLNKDTSSKLIDICFQNGLIPSYIQNQFTSLKQLLVTGIPTIRNKTSGHGQGVVPQQVDDEITRYGLNLTGTNIIFLIEKSGVE